VQGRIHLSLMTRDRFVSDWTTAVAQLLLCCVPSMPWSLWRPTNAQALTMRVTEVTRSMVLYLCFLRCTFRGDLTLVIIFLQRNYPLNSCKLFTPHSPVSYSTFDHTPISSLTTNIIQFWSISKGSRCCHRSLLGNILGYSYDKSRDMLSSQN
jgi:hypothetical protein